MGRVTNWLDHTLYPNDARNWDDSLFRERILAELPAASVILDLGAGAGIVTQMNFRGLGPRVCGIDLDPRVVDNPFLDEGLVSDGASIPYGDEMFDLVFSDNVLEHLEFPETVFAEVSRVLKPGGVFLFKTPNKYHYMPLIASMTPTSFHQLVNKWRGRAEVDIFPTQYRANCVRDIQRLAKVAHFTPQKLELIEGRPEYLRFSVPTYIIGAVYQRLVAQFSVLKQFRILLIGTLKKK